MKTTFKKTQIIAALTALIGVACHTTAQAKAVPAVLSSADEDTMQALKATLAKAMNRSSVEFGPSDPTRAPTFSVLPKSVVGLRGGNHANYGFPTQFDLFVEGSDCYVVKRGTETKIMLDGVKCQPIH